MTITKECVNHYAAERIFKGKISKAGTLLMSFKLTVGKVSISEVGLNQPALNAAFKDAHKDQALRHRHIARKHPDPMDLFDISISIGQRKCEGDRRQPANSPAVRDAAVFHH